MKRALIVGLLVLGCGGRTDTDAFSGGNAGGSISAGGGSGASGGSASGGPASGGAGGTGGADLIASLCRKAAALPCFDTDLGSCVRDIQEDASELEAIGCGKPFARLLECYNGASLTCDGGDGPGLPRSCEPAAFELADCMQQQDPGDTPPVPVPPRSCSVSGGGNATQTQCFIECDDFVLECAGSSTRLECRCLTGTVAGEFSFPAASCEEAAAVGPGICN